MEQLFSNSALQQLSGLSRRNWMAKIIALSLAALVALEKLELLRRFHSFCNHPLVQALANIDHGAHNSRVPWILSDLLHKRFIHLQRIHRKAAQICETGITCTKVVDR